MVAVESAAVATGQPDVQPSITKRFRWAGLIFGGAVLVVAAVLVRPAGSYQAERSEHASLIGQQPVLPFDPGQGIEQQFTANAAGLSQVSVRFGTYGESGRGTVIARLESEDGTPVAVATIPWSQLRDASLMSVATFSPRSESDGQTYRLRISLSADSEHQLTMFGATPTASEPSAQRTDGQASLLAVEIRAEYGGEGIAANQIGTALHRISKYGPFWRDEWFVLFLAVGAILLLAGVALVPRRRGIAVLLAFVVVKALLWSAIIPPTLGVDEGAHVAYAQFLAVEHAIPKRGVPAGSADIYSEQLRAAAEIFHQSDVARSDRADYDIVSVRAGRSRLDSAATSDHSNGNGAAAGYSPAYYAVPALIYAVTPGGIDIRIGSMRLWSVMLGAIAVYFSVRLGRLLFPGRESAALLVGAAVALQPMLSQQTAIVNNDALAIAAGAACAYFAVSLLARDRSRWVLAAAGCAFGIGLLAKPLGLAFAPAIVIAWLIGRWRGCRPAAWWWEALSGLAGVVVTYGLWLGMSTMYGYAGVGFQGEPSPGSYGLSDFLHVLHADSFRAIRMNWIDQFWGNFGWINTPYPPVITKVILVAVVVGSALVAAWVFTFAWDLRTWWRARGRAVDLVQQDMVLATFICLLMVAAALGELYVLMYTWWTHGGDLSFVQGRYGLMMVPVVLVLPTLALRRLIPRLSPLVPLATVASAMGVLNVIAVAIIVERFYL